ncbi:unnamed protein product [Discosporangium mesarthrocarpum]
MGWGAAHRGEVDRVVQAREGTGGGEGSCMGFQAGGEESDSGGRGSVCLGEAEVDLEEVLRGLMAYDRDMDQRVFDKSTQLCPICFDEQPGKSFERLYPCKHAFCLECVGHYCQMHIKDGTVQMLTCPEPSCKETLHPAVVKRAVGDEEYDRWDRLTLLKTLDALADIVYCPRPTCQAPVIEDEGNVGQCPKCFYVFCSLCRESYHPGEAWDPCVLLSMRCGLGAGKCLGGMLIVFPSLAPKSARGDFAAQRYQ